MIARNILKNIRRIEIRTGKLVNEIFAGQYSSVFKGRGMEFSEVREYAPGDDVRSIDWNVTARHGRPFVKRFTEERELTVILLIDASGSQHFGSTAKFKAELAAEIASVLAFSAIRNNDRVGMVVFTDRIEKVVMPKKGRNHILRLIREILCCEPEGRGTDIGLALRYLNEIWRRKAVVFLLSDFDAAGFEKPFRVTARRHDLIGIRLADPREGEIPSVGLVEFEDPETGERTVFDTADRRAVGRVLAERRARRDGVETLFRGANVDRIEVETGRPYILPLIQFFKRREKRRTC